MSDFISGKVGEMINEIEELKKQLQEANAENDKLRKLLNRKKKLAAYPDDLTSKFPNLLKVVGFETSRYGEDKIRFHEQFSQKLSTLIRGTVFADTIKNELKNGRSIVKYVAVQDMDAEEYGIWLETLERVLQALEDGIIKRQSHKDGR